MAKGKKPRKIEVVWETINDPHAEEAIQRVFVMLLREIDKDPEETQDSPGQVH